MARYQVILAYDGTHYAGFQRQVGGGDRTVQRTIQDEVENALSRLGWLGTSILAAGRTDRGVHAVGQVVAFNLDWRHSTDRLQAALNANLPRDIAVRSVWESANDFHPRYDAIYRHYRYQVYCDPIRNPLLDRFAWQVWPPVDLARMQVAAQRLKGTNDYAAFGTPPRPGGNTIRTVFLAQWTVDRQLGQNNNAGMNTIRFDIQANAFLYRMVRRLVYFLVQIGQNHIPANRVDAFLKNPPEKVIQGLAPPQGLTLLDVHYPIARQIEKRSENIDDV